MAATAQLLGVCIMSLFACAPSKAEEKSDVYEKQVYELARKAEADILPKMRPLYLDMLAAHKLDTDSYTLRAERWGDFLALFIARGKEKYIGAVNLGKTQEIKLVLGHAPDTEGRVSYYVNYERDDNKDSCCSMLVSGQGYSREPPPKGYHYTVLAQLDSVRSYYPMLYAIPPAQPCNNTGGSLGCNGMVIGSYSNGTYGGLQTPGAPRNAEDDRIEFVGIATTLYVPAGRGEEVHQAILAEIARKGD
jgi:hypothetical protein